MYRSPRFILFKKKISCALNIGTKHKYKRKQEKLEKKRKITKKREMDSLHWGTSTRKTNIFFLAHSVYKNIITHSCAVVACFNYHHYEYFGFDHNNFFSFFKNICVPMPGALVREHSCTQSHSYSQNPLDVSLSLSLSFSPLSLFCATHWDAPHLIRLIFPRKTILTAWTSMSHTCQC